MGQLLRMVDNDAVDPESVDAIKDSIQYYIDCHQDPDFVLGTFAIAYCS
jgi:CCR4-NOT transcriptional regulation complex NOT5 subunit